jgi:hypothetical protein
VIFWIFSDARERCKSIAPQAPADEVERAALRPRSAFQTVAFAHGLRERRRAGEKNRSPVRHVHEERISSYLEMCGSAHSLGIDGD